MGLRGPPSGPSSDTLFEHGIFALKYTYLALACILLHLHSSLRIHPALRLVCETFLIRAAKKSNDARNNFLQCRTNLYKGECLLV